MRGRDLGLSVAEIRALLSLMNSSEFTCGEVLDMASSHLASIKTKICDLRKLKTSLTRLVRDCEGGEAKDCPVIDALAGVRSA
ncbi:MerR family DNA-binding protein [Euryhalocaulis caribicus]|uniref:MerR family DNA-binding protein n=1 Tax=Euryhalocaulis caribicus TaxID=1161401 RepID=UPI0003B32439|nr:MerR family DNA-binding protein [Euryhalocaulis sp.]